MNDRQMDEKKFRQNSRRELLKLTPVLALGAFAIPSLQEGLLKKGPGLQRLGFGAAFPLRPFGADVRQFSS
jgi:hypothetical protein